MSKHGTITNIHQHQLNLQYHKELNTTHLKSQSTAPLKLPNTTQHGHTSTNSTNKNKYSSSYSRKRLHLRQLASSPLLPWGKVVKVRMQLTPIHYRFDYLVAPSLHNYFDHKWSQWMERKPLFYPSPTTSCPISQLLPSHLHFCYCTYST